jgi:2'-5' RNA ligase
MSRFQTHFTLAYLGRKNDFDDAHERLDEQDEEEVEEEHDKKKESDEAQDDH